MWCLKSTEEDFCRGTRRNALRWPGVPSAGGAAKAFYNVFEFYVPK